MKLLENKNNIFVRITFVCSESEALCRFLQQLELHRIFLKVSSNFLSSCTSLGNHYYLLLASQLLGYAPNMLNFYSISPTLDIILISSEIFMRYKESSVLREYFQCIDCREHIILPSRWVFVFYSYHSSLWFCIRREILLCWPPSASIFRL